MGDHSPYGPSSGLHTLHARYLDDLAASLDTKYTLLLGLVRLPGGQFGRQYMRVVLQAWIMLCWVPA